MMQRSNGRATSGHVGGDAVGMRNKNENARDCGQFELSG